MRRAAHALGRLANAMARGLWGQSPLAARPMADRATYLALHEAAQAYDYPEIDRFEEKAGYRIDPEFLNELALHTQVVVKTSRLSWTHGRVLYSALRRYAATHAGGRINVLETGTARGFSALCMAKALEDADKAGCILTLDLLPHDRAIYWNCIDDLEGPRTRAQLLSPWKNLCEQIVFLWGDSGMTLPGVCVDRIHFAFLDAAHDYRSVMSEFAHIAPRQERGDVIVFDDVTPDQFPGIVRAVDEICRQHGYAREDIVSHERRAYTIATRE